MSRYAPQLHRSPRPHQKPLGIFHYFAKLASQNLHRCPKIYNFSFYFPRKFIGFVVSRLVLSKIQTVVHFIESLPFYAPEASWWIKSFSSNFNFLSQLNRPQKVQSTKLDLLFLFFSWEVTNKAKKAQNRLVRSFAATVLLFSLTNSNPFNLHQVGPAWDH